MESNLVSIKVGSLGVGLQVTGVRSTLRSVRRTAHSVAKAAEVRLDPNKVKTDKSDKMVI